MRLTDLIDLEAQLVLDEERDFDELSRRDRVIYNAIAPDDRTGRAALLTAWLAALRSGHQGSGLGSAVVTGQRLLGYVLIVVGLSAGAGAAGALLLYDGRTPVNINMFLITVVGVQVLLLLLLLVSALAAQFQVELPIVRDARALLRLFAGWLEPGIERVARSVSDETKMRWRAARSRLRARTRLYGGVERWLLIELSQVFGIAFNVGVLVMCLRLIYFSDLAFGWSTTAEALDTSTMYRIVDSLAWPWGWLVSDAVPTYELVSQSRFSRLQGGFTGGANDLMVGQWWRFLIAAVVTYGLIPRVLMWGGARTLRARALARVPLDTPDVERVVLRLESPRVETRSERPPPPNQATRSIDISPMPPSPAQDGAETACFVIRWRQVPVQPSELDLGLRATFGYRTAMLVEAGGLDVAEDETSRAEAAALEDPVVLVAEAWEAPDKGLRRYLTALRSAVGADRPIYVALVGEAGQSGFEAADPEDIAIWRDRLALLEDPYLGVEPLEAA